MAKQKTTHYVNIRELALALKLPRSWLLEQTRRGTIPSLFVGDVLRYDVELVRERLNLRSMQLADRLFALHVKQHADACLKHIRALVPPREEEEDDYPVVNSSKPRQPEVGTPAWVRMRNGTPTMGDIGGRLVAPVDLKPGDIVGVRDGKITTVNGKPARKRRRKKS